jgi:hypothetical protein
VRDVDAGSRLEQFGGEMGGRAVARRGIAQLARFGLGQRHQLGERVHRQRRGHRDDVGHGRKQADGGEVTDRVVAQLAEQRQVGAVRRVEADEQGVAVGRRARRGLGADVAAGTALVFDDDGLTELVAQTQGQRARHVVQHAGGRRRHDDAHRLVRVGRLRQRRSARRTGQQHCHTGA